jgi:hypothetical protein
MSSDELFSHPHGRELVPDAERNAEPVQAPIFSHSDQSDSPDTSGRS